MVEVCLQMKDLLHSKDAICNQKNLHLAPDFFHIQQWEFFFKVTVSSVINCDVLRIFIMFVELHSAFYGAKTGEQVRWFTISCCTKSQFTDKPTIARFHYFTTRYRTSYQSYLYMFNQILWQEIFHLKWNLDSLISFWCVPSEYAKPGYLQVDGNPLWHPGTCLRTCTWMSEDINTVDQQLKN